MDEVCWPMEYKRTSIAHSLAHPSQTKSCFFCLFVCFYKPLPDIVLLYVMFGEGGIVVSVVEMENVSDDQFCTFVLCCRLKRTVLFQGTKDD